MKEYNLSDTSDSATAIIAYTIRAMNNCGFSKMQVDRYIKMIKSLSYNELVNLSNSILSSCNDYIKNLYNDLDEENNMNKKLEARVARLEKLKSLLESKVDESTAENDLYSAIDAINKALESASIMRSQFRKGISSLKNWNLVTKCLANALDELKRVM